MIRVFLPGDAQELLLSQLQDAAKDGKGTLKWFPSTVIKDLKINPTGNIIESATAIKHQAAPSAPPLNTFPLSKTIQDWFKYVDSPEFKKTLIRFVPGQSANWYVVDATETGEIIALADVPYRLGIDPISHLEPSSSSSTGDPYCTQGFTYTFAMQATGEPQTHKMPSFYLQYHPYYSFESERWANNDLLFTYRRIYSSNQGETETFGGITFTKPVPGDISMQNWSWGNDYRPGTSKDNLVYTREQLQATGQLDPGGWKGGLRTETLRKGEENALGFFYWLGSWNYRLSAWIWSEKAQS